MTLIHGDHDATEISAAGLGRRWAEIWPPRWGPLHTTKVEENNYKFGSNSSGRNCGVGFLYA